MSCPSGPRKIPTASSSRDDCTQPGPPPSPARPRKAAARASTKPPNALDASRRRWPAQSINASFEYNPAQARIMDSSVGASMTCSGRTTLSANMKTSDTESRMSSSIESPLSTHVCSDSANSFSFSGSVASAWRAASVDSIVFALEAFCCALLFIALARRALENVVSNRSELSDAATPSAVISPLALAAITAWMASSFFCTSDFKSEKSARAVRRRPLKPRA
mmetsp:Transcript_6589/g.11630  ORF Transcript_6589/g.11630 Transcript_6589/m.11630 type:complete len:222 (+) Transcript_6589:485-1150(+)